MKQKCGAPWACKRNTARACNEDSRKIEGIEVCRSCYQYVWEQFTNRGKRVNKKSLSFKGLLGPKRPIKRTLTVCSRKNCNKELRPGTYQNFRVIAQKPVCRPCYQAAWERSKKRGISLVDAFNELLPK